MTGEDRRAPGWTQGRAGSRRAVPGGHRRRRHVRAARRLPPAAGRGRLRGVREERATSAGRGGRTPIRAAVSTTRATTTATRSPNATTGRCTTPPRTCSPGTSATSPSEHGLLAAHPLRTPRSSRRRGRTPIAAGRCAPERPTAPSTTLVVDAVISATGQLNRPHLPEIPGRDTFAGTGVPLGAVAGRTSTSPGKRVAVIGTGASAAQFIPIVAEQRRRRGDLPAHPGLVRARRPTTTPPSRTACAGCTGTCRTTANGTASGSSGRWATASWRTSPATPSGSRRTPPSAR